MMLSRHRWIALSPALALAFAVHVWAAPPKAPAKSLANNSSVKAKSAAETARLETYVNPAGDGYFALSLTPPAGIATAEAHDIVVLFDTSASQAGPYREKGLSALQGMLAGLGARDRVQLLAVDLNAAPMCETFVAPTSASMTQAIAKLKQRVPLGSTDMELALRRAESCFGKQSAAERAVIYIGDGRSTANLLDTDSFRALVGSLVENRLPVSSFAVGPQVDGELLAVLANQTGGNLLVDSELIMADKEQGITAERARQENLRQAAQIGAQLAGAARAAVLWPSNAEWPAAVAEVYPRTLPPLRTDRDTILVGAGKLEGEVQIRMTAQRADKKADMQWTVAAATASDDGAYLVQVVDSARRDGGLLLPTVGTAGLREARRVVNAETQSLGNLARHAVATGNLKNADLLADETLRRDPGDTTAQAVRTGTKKLRTASNPKGGKPNASDLRLVKQPAAPGNGASLDPLADDEGGDFLDRTENENRVLSERMRTVVEAGLTRARDRMSSEPGPIINELKGLLDDVRRAPELTSEVRAQLADQIEGVLKEAMRREVISDEETRERLEREVAIREQQQILDRLTRKQEKLKQLMDRMNSLIDEGRYREAEEGVGAEVQALAPDSPVTVAAIMQARIKRYQTEYEATREAKAKGFVDSMALVERSSIPFPDEPPIVYPDATYWQEMTQRRKKFASVDLKKRGGAEERISQALEENTTLEFIETPLQDVVEHLKEQHKIEIQLDQKALTDVGVNTDTPITRNLKGISLRSALRLLLRDLDLTYVIRDEVLLLTTPEEAGNQLITKVYPVADLVLPIPQNSMSGMGGMGGGMGGGGGGGMGGGGGGMGGGMGGMGGGGGGMGGGGGGGGFFNIPDAAARVR